MNEQDLKWSENVIIADADYIDRVTFNLIVNFEPVIGRRIPPADLSQWAVCMALDGGLCEGDHETQVVLVHDRKNNRMKNFAPSIYDKELNAKAFKDPKLGEFILNALPTEEAVSKDDLLLDVLNTVCNQSAVKRVMVVPDGEEGEQYAKVRDMLHFVDDDGKRITVFTMQPMPGGNFRQEILGYSLMSALGIHADEIH